MSRQLEGASGPSRPRCSGLPARWASASIVLLGSLIAARAQAQDDVESITPDAESPIEDVTDNSSDDDGAAEPAVEDVDADHSGAVADYALRLQELEDRVNDLKEEIFRSKSRLVLLRERVLRAEMGGSQAIISHVNDMSATFDLVQVIYSLDGQEIFSQVDEDDSLSDLDRFEIYNGAIVSGPHNLSVEMYFMGNGFGVFSYLEGYRFRVRSSYAFNAEDGRVAYLDVVAYEQGGVNQPIEERPDVRYEIEFADAVVNADESAPEE